MSVVALGITTERDGARGYRSTALPSISLLPQEGDSFFPHREVWIPRKARDVPGPALTPPPRRHFLNRCAHLPSVSAKSAVIPVSKPEFRE